MREEDNAVCCDYSLLALTNPCLLIFWAEVDGNYAALSVNTLEYKHVTEFLYPLAGCWVLRGILTII